MPTTGRRVARVFSAVLPSSWSAACDDLMLLHSGRANYRLVSLLPKNDHPHRPLRQTR